MKQTITMLPTIESNFFIFLYFFYNMTKSLSQFKTSLKKAATLLANKMQVKQSDFQNSVEHLDEWFQLIRPSHTLYQEICGICWLDENTTELMFMCLTPETSWNQIHSIAHEHSIDSVSAVIPLSEWWTYLPSSNNPKYLQLVKSECFIERKLPHAFGLWDEQCFMTAIAIWSIWTKQELPITNDDGTYKTHLLTIKNVNKQEMTLE